MGGSLLAGQRLDCRPSEGEQKPVPAGLQLSSSTFGSQETASATSQEHCPPCQWTAPAEHARISVPFGSLHRIFEHLALIPMNVFDGHQRNIQVARPEERQVNPPTRPPITEHRWRFQVVPLSVSETELEEVNGHESEQHHTDPFVLPQLSAHQRPCHICLCICGHIDCVVAKLSRESHDVLGNLSGR